MLVPVVQVEKMGFESVKAKWHLTCLTFHVDKTSLGLGYFGALAGAIILTLSR